MKDIDELVKQKGKKKSYLIENSSFRKHKELIKMYYS